jgi:hypothetical protein
MSGKPNTASAFIEEQLKKGKKPNRLIKEKSPYLLQHAFNPVDWYPWGEEAFAKARAENKPVFVSIGYSTCYWCHVMEREDFEDTAIARLMNENLVCIKVDREERPDIDRIYTSFVQAMTGSGGWPMSVFMTPDQKPFFGGTYFPPIDNYGRPGFPSIVRRISEMWRTNQAKLVESSNEIVRQMQASSQTGVTGVITDSLLEIGYGQFARQYDEQYGGFGGAPKFPRPVCFNFLFRYYARTGNEMALKMCTETLRKMADGGVYDQLGGGFHRYSVDEQWRVPHFEQMLYDQAQLASSYLDAYQITHDEFFSRIAHETLGYVLREMTDAQGGFYSAEDAESAEQADSPEEKEEGAFYVWTKAEIDGVLDASAANIFDYYYRVADEGNALRDPQGTFRGKNILYVAHTVAETARQFNQTPASIEKSLSASRQKLLTQREKRPRPHLDDKILTSWNGLMISAFARGYQVLNDPRYLQAAQRAAQFITTKLYDTSSGKLFRRWRDDEARFDGSLEDYAFLTAGLLDLYEASFDVRWLEIAVKLTSTQNALFWDTQNGGYFDTPQNELGLLLKTKDDYDSAEPSGNSIAAMNLLRLAEITDNKEWREMAKKTIETFGERLEKTPFALPQMLCAVEWIVSTPKEIVIAGSLNTDGTNELLRQVDNRYIPDKILLLADDRVATLSPFLARMKQVDGKATAYVCENYTCNLPTSDTAELAALLQKKPMHRKPT